MPNFAANLSMMYGEHPFLDRFDAAAADGFAGVEFLFPYEFEADAIASRLRASNLVPALFNCPPGDWAGGERGLASLPGREDAFRRSFDLALQYAHVIGPRALHVMAGVAQPGLERARQRATYVANLAWAARHARGTPIMLLIEPINTRDVPGYLLNRQDEAHEVLADVAEPNLKVQMDLYHCQIVEGDLAVKIERYLPAVGHMQIAGVPGRHEPDVGEIHYPYLFERIDALGYSGWIGCEYRPRARTSDGLGWFARWRRPAR